MRSLLPEGWPRPRGYSNGVLADGATVFVAGMIGWNQDQELASGFVAQFRQALRNTVDVLAEAGAGPEHVARMTWFVTDLDAYRDNLVEVGEAYRDVMGKHFPAMAVVGVTGLVEPEAMIEIESTAVVRR
ncbi:MAG: RidA family protein [Gammaproteobacteria bacterium]|nr:RidA family protein [Gammaproteobacteria bacterium]MDH5346072.1 RidA family protein [Gammaproteobacteria bacterium]